MSAADSSNPKPVPGAEPVDGGRPLSRRARRRSQLSAIAVLVAVWVLLWGTLSWANLISGLVVAVVILIAFPLPPIAFGGRVSPPGLLRFALRFLWDLVVASVEVAWQAVRIGPPPRSAIIAVRLRVQSDLNMTAVAEFVSLVPGSLIVEADRDAGILYIHALGVRDRAEVERFRRNVLDLEARITAAVGSEDERQMVTRPGHVGPPPSGDGRWPAEPEPPTDRQPSHDENPTADRKGTLP